MTEPQEPGSADSPPPAAQPETVTEPSSAEQQPPPVPEPSQVPSTVAPAHWQGPLGQPRSVVFVIVMSILTIGIYYLYWAYKTYDEMKHHTGNGIGGILGLVIALVINPVNWFVLPSEVGQMYKGDGRSAPMTGWTGLWILLPIVGWFVWTAKVQGALSRYWQSKQQTP